MNNKRPKMIDYDKSVVLPIIKRATDISFGSLGYVEAVVGALLACKEENGSAWGNVSQLVDVTVVAGNVVGLTLKVHSIDTSNVNSDSLEESAVPDVVKFAY